MRWTRPSRWPMGASALALVASARPAWGRWLTVRSSLPGSSAHRAIRHLLQPLRCATATGRLTSTPTPSPTEDYVISADQQYAYTLEILGSFSGGSADFSGAYAPHPVFTNELGEAVQQLNGIAIGGFNGLNN